MGIHADIGLAQRRDGVRGYELTLALVAEGHLGVSELAGLRQHARASGARIEELLIASGRIAEPELIAFAGQRLGLKPLDALTPADPALLGEIGKTTCRRLGFMPLHPEPFAPVVALSKPWNLTRILMLLPDSHADARFVTVTSGHLEALITAAQEEPNLSGDESCRNWSITRARRGLLLALFVLSVLAVLAPAGLLVSAVMLAVGAMTGVTFLKALALAASLRPPVRRSFATQRSALDPVVTLLVPLYRERDIAGRLVKRLTALDRPAELLEILLVVEADDRETRQALARADLPRHIRIIEVPAGPVRTKPHALNHAAALARGDIIGIYDAEDEPAPDQLTRVVRAFAEGGPDLACVQGKLDFYNTRATWLTRMFTLDYAAWFRVVLPGLERLGLVIPLGGTTLFFRRDALERLGGWDDWNVTEDADLGVRLARHGWHCHLLDTVTREEAVAHLRPWIRQRSRWLKGYAMTWATHMKDPMQLWRDLGAWRFFALQIQFAASLLQYALAPLLWSFWLIPFTDVHPIERVMSQGQLLSLFWLFFGVTVLDATVSVIGLIRARRIELIPMIPLAQLYFLFGAIAAYRGLAELFYRPFHWEKTEHGKS